MKKNPTILEKVRKWGAVHNKKLLDLDRRIDIHPRLKVRQRPWDPMQADQ